MTTIEPSTPVRVVIEGRVFETDHARINIDTRAGTLGLVMRGDSAVTVKRLDPERPTLDRDALKKAVQDNAYDGMHGGLGGEAYDQICGDITDAVLALIQAAHPEWIA